MLVKECCLNISLKSKDNFTIFQAIVLDSIKLLCIKWKPMFIYICFKKKQKY